MITEVNAETHILLWVPRAVKFKKRAFVKESMNRDGKEEKGRDQHGKNHRTSCFRQHHLIFILGVCWILRQAPRLIFLISSQNRKDPLQNSQAASSTISSISQPKSSSRPLIRVTYSPVLFTAATVYRNPINALSAYSFTVPAVIQTH